MINNKNATIFWTLVATSLLAIALGLAATFGKFGQSRIYDIFNELYPIAPGVIKSHFGMAFIGGVLSISFGTISLIMLVSYIKVFSTKPLKIEFKFFAYVFVIVLFAMAVAAIVCQTDLNNEDWLKEQTRNMHEQGRYQ